MTITFAAYTDTSPNALTARLHRAPRARLRDSDGTAIQLHRAHAVAMQGSRSPIHASMRFTRPPQVRLSDRTGDLLLLHRAPQLNLSGTAPIPTVTVFSLPAPAHRVSMAISRHHALQFHHQPRVLLAAGVRFALQRRRHVLLRDDGVTSDRTALMFQQPELLSSMVPGLTVQLASGIALASSAQVAQVTYRLSSVLALHGALNPLAEIARRLDSAIGLNTVVELALYLRAQSALGVHDASAQFETLLLVLADTLAIMAGTSSLQEADALLATIFALADTADTPLAELLQSALGVSAGLAVDVAAYAMALSAVRVSAALTGTLTLTAVLADTFALSDTITTVAELMRAITSAIGVSVTLPFGDEVYGAWVMDATSKAAWSYTNFPFNSFAQLGERFLGAGPDGIYELSGDDDDGTPIDWSVRTGLLNFGTNAEKRIDTAYIGYTSTGTVGLSVITTSPDGEKVQYNYHLIPRTANAPRENRIKVGKGLKSVYFAFELAGTGAFALQDMQLLPMVLGRRI